MSIPRRAVTAGLLLLAWSAPARADLWYESYEKADEAMQSENWTEAVGFLSQALQEKADSAARARTYGMNFISYFPYYKLGIAYYNLGRFDDAKQAFETESQLGAIAQSASDLAELQRYQLLVEEGRVAAAEREQQRIRQVLSDGLTNARRLGQDGQYQDALAAADRALAVAPDNAEAQALKQQLLADLARFEEQQRQTQRAAELVDEGRSQLEAGRFAEASSTFSRAIDIRDDPATRTLLEQAQGRLRSQVEQQNRQQAIADGIAAATGLEADGDYVGALEQLQPVLVLEPENRQAREAQQRIVRAQTERETRIRTQQTLQQLLGQARSDLDRGAFKDSLASANHALALDPGNPEALQSITTAYAAMNRQLLGGGAVKNLPPGVRFFDFRKTLPDGSRVEHVDAARFRLRGEVSDATVVDLEVRGPRGEIIENVDVTQQTDDENLRIITGFTIDYDLSHGTSVFEVTATDPDGLATSADYAVSFTVPFYKTPWPYAVVLASLAASLFAVRHLRRRRLLARRYNPYVTGAPVLNDEAFFGRERLMNHVLQRVHINSVLLYGERRIGKTSFQHHLKRRLEALDDPHYVFYPVYTDLQGVTEGSFFATLAEDAFQELRPHLDGLEPSAALDDGADYDYRAFVADVRRIVTHLKSKNKKRVPRIVFQIDEVDELNTYDPRVNQKLRSLFMKTFAENLVAVVSGVGIKKQWEREGSPWYNFFQEIQVKPFRREDAEKLIRVPIRGVFELDQGVVDTILEMVDSKPYPIQKLCATVVNRMYEERRRRITVEDVRAARAQVEI